MKLKLLFLFIFLSSISSLQGQKKSELISEIAILKKQLDSVNSEIIVARKNEKVAQSASEFNKAQVEQLQSANKTLMTSLTSFTEVSTKNSNNFNMAMESLTKKEQQLKAIKNSISSNDSTALVVLTNAKQTLGENARIGVVNGMVVISSDLTTLFGSDTESTIAAAAETWVQKIGEILKANPNMAVTIEGLSMTGNLDLPALQASSVGNALQRLEIAPERITTLGKDGNLKEGVVIKIHPRFDKFYLMVKDNMKNTN